MALRRLTTVAKNHLPHPPVSFPSATSKEPSWGANVASAEAVTEARRRAVNVPVRRARKTVDATALYKAADGAALAIRVPTPRSRSP
jgi:hypothetical protein